MVRIQLTNGVSVSIPADWTIQDAQRNLRRFDRGQRIMDLVGIPAGPGGVLLTASPDGNPDRISVVISLIRRPSATQEDVAQLQGEQLEQVNQQYREDLEAGMRAEHATMVEWGGAAKVRLGDLYSLVSYYTYAMPERPVRAMESHRIFLGGGSIGFMVQAPPGDMERLRPIFTAIRQSFRASPIP